jgi:gas vesicle protein
VENNNQKLLKFFGKVAIGFAINAVLTPPVALYLGSVTYGTSKCLEYMVEEEDKETCRFISDCAMDVATGGLLDCAVGAKAVSLASQTTHSIGQQASKEIARNGMTEVAKELIINGKVASDMQKSYEIAKNVKDVGSTFIELAEQIKHKIHLDNNINYLESCKICKS